MTVFQNNIASTDVITVSVLGNNLYAMIWQIMSSECE